MKVKPNLFLNMSPQTTEEGGLAFARNMKLDDDGNLVSDYGYKNIGALSTFNIVGHIVGLNNYIYFFCHTNTGTEENPNWVDRIIRYNEVTGICITLTSGWTWSGGEIDGYVSTNQSGEQILTIAEYIEGGSQVPLKHINLSFLSPASPSFYTQAPECPTVNLNIKDTYAKSIPNGVYVFFIRYKLRKDVYTNWFLCSKPIFAGTADTINTLQGGLKYINLHKDSAKSFVLQLEFVVPTKKDSYSEFQLGFIITHDEATDARVWKHFDMDNFVTTKPYWNEIGHYNQNVIYFDYDGVEEANIDDFIETTYELYNVRNVTSFKNKLYISNYKETNFNFDGRATVIEDEHSITKRITDYIDLGYNSIDYSESPDIYNKEILTLGSYNYELKNYDNDFKCYTLAEIGSTEYSIKNIISSYISTYGVDSIFNINISDFYKGETVELEDALNITYFGDVDEDPDIIYAHLFNNNLANKVIFGNDYTRTYHSTGNAWHDVGLDIALFSMTMHTFNVLNYAQSPHPWYNSKNFPIGFGVFGNDNEYVPSQSENLAEGNIIIINKDNIDTGYCAAGARFFESYIRSDIAKFVKKAIEDKSRLIIGYATIYSGLKEYVIVLSNYVSKSDFNQDNYVGDDNSSYYFDINSKNNSSETNVKNAILRELKNMLSDKIKGIDDSGNVTLDINGESVKANNITFTFKACEFKVDSGTDIDTNDANKYNVRFNVTLKSTYYNCLVLYSLKGSALTITEPSNSTDVYKQQSTLMPFSDYAAYIHFVDDHNIITNGIFLKNIKVNTAPNINQSIIKYILKYKLTNVPQEIRDKYKSFFVSLVNVGDIIIESFEYSKVNDMHIINVIESDALLYNINEDITIIDENGSFITDTAKYYSSGESTPALAFGNCGFIGWQEDMTSGSYDYTAHKFYIRIHKTTAYDIYDSSKKNYNLIKATPYLPLDENTYAPNTQTNVFFNITDGFYGGYFCSVKKPSLYLSSQCYVSGNDVYAADRQVTISLKNFDQYINSQDSITYFIRSNFNLNYLSLTQDINDRIYSIGTIKQVKKTIDSAVLSYIYELKSMYKDFFNKYFVEYDSDSKVDFDNTIRVSHVLSDETFNNSVFKFSATDYYNIPTDRGIIVNLFSIGNDIFVHTKDSFYKFDGNHTISASDNDIQLQESEPFDNGITQIFDSEYGYGGIDIKHSGCISFDSYFFYDKQSNHIFAYGGNSQVQIIDGNIYKLLTYYKPKDCIALHDEANCRVLFEFTSGRSEHSSADYKTFTLSYNYKTKTFVSLHDLSLINSFASKHKVYSYKDKLLQLFVPDNVFDVQTGRVIDTTVLVAAMNVNKIFGNATTACIIEFGSQIYKKQIAPFGIAIVMFPRENIREVVNSIKYIADIQQKDPEKQTNPIYDVLVNPQVTRNNPVVNFYIITDCCVSSIVNTNVNDNTRPNTLLDYKGFKFDMGAWTSNYFRNDINKTDIYDYGQKYPNRDLDADQNSLVYGRYFIITFDFKADTPIKFEELFMNSEKY